MLNKFPDQASARKGFAVVGGVFLIFGIAMSFFGDTLGAVIGFSLGGVLFVPAVAFGHTAFAKIERTLSWLS